MSVVHVNSISGITSITAPSSSDVLTLHSSNTSEKVRITSGGVTQITKGTSGGATANTDAALIVDNSSHTYVQFRTPATKEQGLLFGDDADNDAGGITYDHNNNALGFRVNAASVLSINSNGLVDFKENTVQKAVLKNYTETVKAIGDTGTSATLDLADGNVFTATLTGNCTFTFTTGTNSAPNAASFTLILANDSTPSRTITWPAAVKWPNNSAPSRTTTASKTDIWTFMTPDNGTTWYGNIALYNFT